MTKASAKDNVDAYSPARLAFPKKDARKWVEAMNDSPARVVRKIIKMSDVLTNRTWVMITEENRKPGKYRAKNDNIVERIRGTMVTC